MNRTKKQFCRQGHDTFLYGRRTNRACVVCSREANYRQFKANPEKWKTWQRNWRAENPEKVANTKWRTNKILNSRSEPFTTDDFKLLYERQNGKCWICGIHQDDHQRALFVDHDHKTGIARGLLCNSCNKMLGDAKDSVLLLQKAIQYLEAR